MSHRRAWWVVEPGAANAVRLWIAHATAGTARRLARQLARTLRVNLTVTDVAPRAAINPRSKRARFTHRRLRSPQGFDPRSFRTVKRGGTRVVVGCPRGQYQAKRKRCRIGTRAQAVLRPKSRRRNPASLAPAVATFRRFHGFDPSSITRVTGASRTIPATLVDLGELVEVSYRSNKFDRKTRDYVHRFGSPRPLLCTRPDGRGLYIVGGKFRNTARGIVG